MSEASNGLRVGGCDMFGEDMATAGPSSSGEAASVECTDIQ